MFDIAIIGAGVIGSAIARELSKYKLNIVVLEKQNDVACGATKANSALIHAGFDAPYNTLRGETNVRGNYLYEQITKDLKVPFKRNGALVIAFKDDEIEILNQLKINGEKAGIRDLRLIDNNEVTSLEPNLNGSVLGALSAPSAGIINPWEMAIGFIENAMENGVELKLNYEVKEIEKTKQYFNINSKNEDKISTKYIINASGINADDVYSLVADSEFEISPRRGEYYLLDKEVYGLVNRTIFRCPTEKGKGVLISPTIDGNILVGPTSEDLPRDMKKSNNTTLNGLDEIRTMAKKIIMDIPVNKNITNYAGLRAKANVDDFIIEESKKVRNFINVAGINSPGLSAAPAIAEIVKVIIVESEKNIQANEKFNPIRETQINLKDLNNEGRNEYIKNNPRYGKIICRCEEISEGEIIDAINRTCGATTINGIKRRVRPGAGRCQGGFCGPRVAEIIAKELKIGIKDVLLENKGSNIILDMTKKNYGDTNEKY